MSDQGLYVLMQQIMGNYKLWQLKIKLQMLFAYCMCFETAFPYIMDIDFITKLVHNYVDLNISYITYKEGSVSIKWKSDCK